MPGIGCFTSFSVELLVSNWMTFVHIFTSSQVQSRKDGCSVSPYPDYCSPRTIPFSSTSKSLSLALILFLPKLFYWILPASNSQTNLLIHIRTKRRVGAGRGSSLADCNNQKPRRKPFYYFTEAENHPHGAMQGTEDNCSVLRPWSAGLICQPLLNGTTSNRLKRTVYIQVTADIGFSLFTTFRRTFDIGLYLKTFSHLSELWT